MEARLIELADKTIQLAQKLGITYTDIRAESQFRADVSIENGEIENITTKKRSRIRNENFK